MLVERAGDVSAILDAAPSWKAFEGGLDLSDVLAVGFSLGSHTGLTLLGAKTDMETFGTWAAGGPFSKGPGNFPDLADRLPDLFARSEVFRSSWQRQGLDYRDPRIAAALLLAPAPPVRAFPETSLGHIVAPVHIIAGGADREAPMAIGAEWLTAHLPRCSLDIVAEEGGHFIFLPEPTEAGRRNAPALCLDPPGVDRAQVHAKVAVAAEDLVRSRGR